MKTTSSFGFSLIELVISLAILGVLASLTIPLAEHAIKRSKEAELRDALREIRKAIDAYKSAYDEGKILNAPELSGYPPSLEVLVDGVPNQRDGQRKKIYFLRRIPSDPFVSNPAHQAMPATWGLRSFASDANDPQTGADVFDVYSQSIEVGLNGVPYKKW